MSKDRLADLLRENGLQVVTGKDREGANDLGNDEDFLPNLDPLDRQVSQLLWSPNSSRLTFNLELKLDKKQGRSWRCRGNTCERHQQCSLSVCRFANVLFQELQSILGAGNFITTRPLAEKGEETVKATEEPPTSTIRSVQQFF